MQLVHGKLVLLQIDIFTSTEQVMFFFVCEYVYGKLLA